MENADMKDFLIIPLGIFFGIILIIIAATDNDRYMNSIRMRLWVGLFGREGARIFLFLFGLFLIFFAFWMLCLL